MLLGSLSTVTMRSTSALASRTSVDMALPALSKIDVLPGAQCPMMYSVYIEGSTLERTLSAPPSAPLASAALASATPWASRSGCFKGSLLICAA